MNIKEGYMPFRDGQTYYRIAGECEPGKKPLLCLHGGPGSTHNYFEVLDYLAEEEGRQVISYDQIGCGLSSAPDDPSVYTLGTWMDELKAIREHLQLDELHIIGQSWGGMLLIAYLCDEPHPGLKSAILASTLSSSSLWEQEGRRHIRMMPQKYQDALAEAEATGNYSGPAYDEAIADYMVRFCDDIPADKRPECLTRPKKSGSLSYITAWGPNEYRAMGNLNPWEWDDKLPSVDVPCLITSGTNDLCSPLVAKRMFDLIPGAKWHLFAHSTHMSFVEEPEEYRAELVPWLNEHD